jgi:hypothetical protein
MGVFEMRRRLTPAVALLVAVALVGCQNEPIATTTTTATTTSTTTIPTPSTTSGPTASQTPADALRDGVIPELAALPHEIRVGVISSAASDEGTWVLSRPPAEIEPYTDECRLGAETGRYPTDFICTTEYGEVLLIQDGAIRKAFPFPGVPPEFLVLTDDAVYCARGGEPMLPDSMVCRIDRTTLDATVRVFPGEIDSVIAQPCFYPPDHWSIDDHALTVKSLEVDDQGVWVDGVGGPRRLDLMTLEPVGSVRLPDLLVRPGQLPSKCFPRR